MKLIVKNNKITFFKKITGTNVAELAGMNKFKPRGDMVLSMLGLVTEPFDEFYTKRGEIAEKLALQTLKKRNLPCVVYNKREVGYDNFPDNRFFGGLIDIEIPALRTLYEIKSKNIKDYDKIEKFGDSCQEEQAMHYGWLRHYDKVHIMWIFFTDEIEEKIKAGEPITSYAGMKMFEKELVVDDDVQEDIHRRAAQYYVHCVALGEVPIEDISDKYLNLLHLTRPENVSNPEPEKPEPVQLSLDLF